MVRSGKTRLSEYHTSQKSLKLEEFKMSTSFRKKLAERSFPGRLETIIENNDQVFQIKGILVKWFLWKKIKQLVQLLCRI